ncbi:hypothetical protein [Acinetobacter indicus]|uniref:Uncharacterized protein n=1 Tax=Acinetobacter indicus TaxID=756892 RepID=A0A173DXI1_9GAMM|nr:hypothetical protein [Acinetobacter indicus]ANG65636.1 hypothetical protein [Acinetobacter indicus]
MSLIGHAYLDSTKVDLVPFECFYTALAQINTQRIDENLRLEDIINPSEKNILIGLIQKNELKKTKTELPLVHYLFSLFNVSTENKLIAFKWAIFNISCIESIADAENITENNLNKIIEKYRSTIQDICRCFRLANGNKNKLYETLSAIPSDPQGLVDQLESIISKNKDLLKRSLPSLSEEEINRLSVIKNAYNFIVTQRKRLRAHSSRTRKTSKSIDQPAYRHKKVSFDDEVLLLTTFRGDEKAYDIEDQEQSTLQDHGFNFNEKEKNSLSFQRIKLKTQAQHQQKNNLMSKSNPRVYDLLTAQIIMQRILEKATDSPIHSLLLFSVLSLTHYKDILSFNHKPCESNRMKNLFLNNFECYFRQAFDVSTFKTNNIQLKEHKLNTTNSYTIPLPQTFFSTLIQLKKWDMADIESDLEECLRIISQDLTFSLTAENLPRLLSDITFNELGYELESKLLAGTSIKHYVPCNYFSSTVVDLLDSYEQSLRLIAPTFETQYIHKFSSAISFGSQQSPDLAFTQAFFKELDRCVRQVNDPFVRLNNYSIWLWHICMIITSARPSQSFPPNLHYIDFEMQVMGIADKEQRYSGTIGRYIPFNNFLKAELQHYFSFLKKFKSLTKILYPSDYTQPIDDVLNGQTTLLLFHDKHKLRLLNLSDLQDFYEGLDLQKNWTRHFCRYFFAQFCDEDIIKSIFGHDENMQSVFDKYSSFKPTSFTQIREAQDKLVKILGLNSMSDLSEVAFI